MLGTILVLLLVLWLLGFIRIPGLIIHDMVLFSFNGQDITLWKFLTFIVILWAAESLPSPLRQIIVVLILLWVLAQLGFIVLTGFSNLILVAIIAGVVLSLFNK